MSNIAMRIMGFSNMKYRGLINVMAGVGTREFSQKCYSFDTGLHLKSFIGNGDLDRSV
jgi:hypothetical protein